MRNAEVFPYEIDAELLSRVHLPLPVGKVLKLTPAVPVPDPGAVREAFVVA